MLVGNDLNCDIVVSDFELQSNYYVHIQNNFWRQLHKNAARNIEQVLKAASHKAAAVRPPTTHHENHKN